MSIPLKNLIELLIEVRFSLFFKKLHINKKTNSKIISFLHGKLHSWYDKDDKYIDVVNEMYEDNVLDDDDIEDLDLSKEKDDYER